VRQAVRRWVSGLRSHERAVAAAAAIAVVGLTFVYGRQVLLRYLVNDDYQVLYTAWLKSLGKVPGRDFFMASYHLLFDLLAPLVALFSESLTALYLGRVAMLLVLGATGLVLYRITSHMFGRVSGFLAPVLAMSTGALLHRGLDLRPDGLTTLVWLTIGLVILKRSTLDRRRAFTVGLLIGLACVNRFKGVLVGPVVVGLVAYDAWTAKPPIRRVRAMAIALLSLALGTATSASLYGIVLLATGQLGAFVRVTVDLTREIGAIAEPFERHKTLLATWSQDRAFWLLATTGAAMLIAAAIRRFRREHAVGLGLLLLASASLLLNPAYYCYNLVTLIPLVAPLAACPVGWLLDRLWDGLMSRGRRTIVAVLGACLTLSPVLAKSRELWQFATVRSNAHQLALQRFLFAATSPSDAVFALEGIGLFRPSVYPWRLPAVLLGLYRRGDVNYDVELADVRPEVIVTSYRVPDWLVPRDAGFIDRHFVALAPFLLVPGFAAPSAGAHSFEILSPGRYDVLIAQGGHCMLDATDVHAGQIVDLSSGMHELSTEHASCAVRRHYSPDAIAMVANPHHIPYLIPPTLDMVGRP